MDANSTDPRTDEAVQRIKYSLGSIDERTECHRRSDEDTDDAQDHGADEAVQRIQNSISRIDTRAEAHKENQKDPDPLTGLLSNLAASAHLDTQSSELYQNLATKETVTAVLHEAVRKQIAIASTTAAVLRDKHGFSVDRPGYKVLKALAWHYEDISEEAKSLGDPDWSARGLWEIERVLRDSAPRTEVNGTRDLIRVNTDPNSEDFAKAVNGLAKATGMDVDDALETVKDVFAVLRGVPYDETEEPAAQD